MQKRCYFGCEFKGSLHSFPSPNYPHEDRFNKWKSVLSEDTKNRGNSYIYGNIRLCGRHFEPYYKTRGNRLTANSAPTLNLFQQGVPASVLPEVEPQIADNLMISSPTATGKGTFKTKRVNSKSKTQKVIGTHKCITDSPLCRACMESDETPKHVLLECSGVSTQREAYIGSPATLPEVLADLGGLLGFWSELGWLE